MNHEAAISEMASTNEFLERCRQYGEAYERMAELNGLQAKRIDELEQEHQQLRAEIERLSQPQVTAEINAFLDAMEPIIANEESLTGRTHNKQICELYRAIKR